MIQITPQLLKETFLEIQAGILYTPYQAEIAQGRLEALFNFQTIICELTGMRQLTYQLLDESTAAAEAATMLLDHKLKNKKSTETLRHTANENVLLNAQF